METRDHQSRGCWRRRPEREAFLRSWPDVVYGFLFLKETGDDDENSRDASLCIQRRRRKKRKRKGREGKNGLKEKSRTLAEIMEL